MAPRADHDFGIASPLPCLVLSCKVAAFQHTGAGIEMLRNRKDRLWRTRTMARCVIVAGRLWTLLLPFMIVAGLFASTAWLGIFRSIPDMARTGLGLLFVLAFLASLVPLRRAGFPSSTEIDRHIERTNRLAHTPVTAQADRLSGTADPFAQALWREHKERMAKGLEHLTGGLPRTEVPERDPWALRAAVLLLAMIAFAWSFGPNGGSLTDPFRAHAARTAVPVRIDAWVTPPAYTGRAPIYLTAGGNPDRDAFDVPAGSVVTTRASGGTGAFALEYVHGDGTVAAAEAEPATGDRNAGIAQQFTKMLERDGELVLSDDGAALQSWRFTIIADTPPRISFAGDPKRAVNGTLELSYAVEDDYGAATAAAEFELADDATTDARPLYDAPDFSLNLPRRGASSGETRTSRDLTEHPWAGARVVARLRATDDAGQSGVSEARQFVLPERAFSNPLARAVIEQRRMLALDANAKRRVLDMMEAVLVWPEETLVNAAHYLALIAARSRLQMAQSDDQLRAVVDYLWEVARGIEDGDLSEAEKRLRQAQEALRQALEDGASDEEIEKLMAELREALNEYLRELAERAMQDPGFAQQMPQDGREMNQADLERMLDQIEQLAKSGARDQAQELLSRLQEMMNNLQAMRQQGGQQQGGQQGEMRQQMDRLGEIMRRQQELMNETFRMDQLRRGERGQRGENGEQQEGPGMTPEEFAEALRQLQEGQGQLQGELGELMEGLRDLGIEPGEGFGEAGEHMGNAGRALGEGNGEQAVGEQGQALEALRRGAQDMMNQMQQAMQGEGPGNEVGTRRPDDRDPLGRPRATTGPDFGDSVEVPDEIDVQRAREILEAIRKRLGDALSPALEKEYLERLLELR